jgi:hypothetical protein
VDDVRSQGLDFRPLGDEISQGLRLDGGAGDVLDLVAHELECPFGDNPYSIAALDNFPEWERGDDNVAEPLELFRLKHARHRLGRRQKLSALQTEQLIGLSGHRPIQPRLHRIDVGLPRTKTSPALQQLTTFTPQDN